MTLEYWKREKNFRALEKGYARDPEGFPFKFLLKRLRDEVDELETALINETGYEDTNTANFYLDSQAEEIIKECADVSNLVDYIASKALSFWPDKYEPDASKSTHVDLSLREESQAGEAQPGPGCTPGFQDCCVDEVGTACPSYREGHCAKVEEEREL